MANIKTYTDMLNDKHTDAEALKLFNELYEKINALSDKELRYISESVKNNIPENVESIETELNTLQNEGFFGGATGLIGGLIAGDKLGKAICQALGVTNGPLYNLLTSKVVIAAISTYLGAKI